MGRKLKDIDQSFHLPCFLDTAFLPESVYLPSPSMAWGDSHSGDAQTNAYHDRFLFAVDAKLASITRIFF